jgi:hypothetical protein
MSATEFDVVCFIGPSLWDVDLDAGVSRGIELRSPVRRGDVDALVAERQAGVIAIADGLFHLTLAVGHAEIRRALGAGWQVWGLSSIGAIRACEMQHLGMRGFGEVYRRFAARPSNYHDDEVAMLHAGGYPYQPVSEPLVHIRIALSALVEDSVISPADRRTLLRRLKGMWYGDRTLAWVRNALSERVPESASNIEARLNRFERYRAKTHDAVAFLEQRPWTAHRPHVSG